MSDSFLRVIPVTPEFAPTTAADEAVRQVLRSLAPRSQVITSKCAQRIRFVDCGSNLERVVCPTCGQDLLQRERWQKLMEWAFTKAFAELEIAVPCCGTRTSLNALRFEWPCGFARYVLEAQNPGRGQLAADEKRRLALALGSDVRIIWAHI